jgi:hypothetical protein
MIAQEIDLFQHHETLTKYAERIVGAKSFFRTISKEEVSGFATDAIIRAYDTGNIEYDNLKKVVSEILSEEILHRTIPAPIDKRVPQETSRHCKCCQELLPIQCFSSYAKGFNTYQLFICRKCSYKKGDSQKRRDTVNACTKKWRVKNRDELSDQYVRNLLWQYSKRKGNERNRDSFTMSEIVTLRESIQQKRNSNHAGYGTAGEQVLIALHLAKKSISVREMVDVLSANNFQWDGKTKQMVVEDLRRAASIKANKGEVKAEGGQRTRTYSLIIQISEQ